MFREITIIGGVNISTDLTNDEWNHIVITKSDNSTDDKMVRMYTGGSFRVASL